jgi:DNA-binding transcriptional LysR family regulator
VNPIVGPPIVRPMKRGADASPAQDITALRSALLVREHLGFRRASEVLGVNQSVLSRRVLALEDALGVSLFQRHAGGARPTGAGERFLREVAQALMLLQQAAAQAGAAGRGEVGRLKLGHVWPVSAGPAEGLLRAYRRGAGDVEIDLHEAPAADLAAALLERDLDMALMDADDAPPALDRLLLWSEPWLLATPADAPAPTDCWRDITIPAVLCCAADDWSRIQRLVIERGGPPHAVRVQHTSRDGVLSLVATGAGWAIVPKSVADATRAGVRFSPLPGRPASLRLCAAWLNDNDNPTLRRFLSLMRATPLYEGERVTPRLVLGAGVQ